MLVFSQSYGQISLIPLLEALCSAFIPEFLLKTACLVSAFMLARPFGLTRFDVRFQYRCQLAKVFSDGQ